MPIPHKVKYKCKKCGYSITKIEGDVIVIDNVLLKCPICGGKMERSMNIIKILDKWVKK